MRRLGFIFLAIYLVFLGGSAYYSLVFPIRVLHHVLITVLLALWLINRLRRGQGLPHTPLNAPLGAAVVVWTISAAASLDPRLAFEHLWFQLIHLLFFFALVELLRRGRQRLLWETQFLLAALVVFLSGLELASWYFGLGIIPGTQTGWIDVIGPAAWLPLRLPRLALAMNISTLLAAYTAPLVILTAAWAITAHRQYRAALGLLAALLLVVLALTLSRGGILSLLAAVGVWGVLRLAQTPAFTRRFPARLFMGGAAALGVAALIGFIVLSLSSSRSWGDAGRVDMWRSAVLITRDYPLTGVGPGLFGHALRDYRAPLLAQDKLVSAHNAVLNTAAESGLPGLLVSLWLAITFLQAWRRNWRAAPSTGRKIRLEAALAALVGLGVHSLVDVFTITPIVLLIALLAAYGITPLPDSIIQRTPPRTTHPVFAAAALLVVLVYGAWFIQLDRAQSRYQDSFRSLQTALAAAQAAAELDPALNLYHLNVAYLTSERVPPEQAISAYESALALEPTWDVGWANLAALKLRAGDKTGALAAFDRARQIRPRSPASVRWAQLAEDLNAAPADTIAGAYDTFLDMNPVLPLAAFWWETASRRQAVERYLAREDTPPDLDYRVLAAHEPERAYALVPVQPQTAAEYWMAGEYALTVENEAGKAAGYFTQAVERARTVGDYYASRARATWQTDPEAAQRDLDIAALLATQAEYPDAIRAEMTSDPDAAHQLRANALPPRQSSQEFAAALYGRPAVFDLLTEARPPGPGRAAMQPWYTIAANYLDAGDRDRAVNVYSAILDYAPDEAEARAELNRLTP